MDRRFVISVLCSEREIICLLQISLLGILNLVLRFLVVSVFSDDSVALSTLNTLFYWSFVLFEIS